MFVCFPLSASLLFFLSFFLSFYLGLPLFLSCPYFLLHSSNFLPLRSPLYLSLITFRLISSSSVSTLISLTIQCSFHLSFCVPSQLLSSILSPFLPPISLFPFTHFILYSHSPFCIFFFFLNPLPCSLYFTNPHFSLPFFLQFLPSSLYITFSFLPPANSKLASYRSSPTHGCKGSPIYI